MKLIDLTEIAINSPKCVVLKIKDGHEMDLIALGCFDGDETMFRLTKGRDITCTVFRKNGAHYDWHWGDSGYTLVSPKLGEQGRMIQSCIEQDYKIKCKLD